MPPFLHPATFLKMFALSFLSKGQTINNNLIIICHVCKLVIIFSLQLTIQKCFNNRLGTDLQQQCWQCCDLSLTAKDQRLEPVQ